LIVRPWTECPIVKRFVRREAGAGDSPACVEVRTGGGAGVACRAVPPQPANCSATANAVIVTPLQGAMSGKLTLFVCHIDDGGPPPHACKRAQRALRDAGHEFDKVIAGRGRPFGLFTKGKRPELRAMSGQEMLPVLRLPDGSTINGSSEIIDWARRHAPFGAPDA
jgi:Glutathione S-transferase, N-terminal domain